MRIGKGERGVGREAALGQSVADAEEVHADRRVGIGARLDILRSCGGRGDKSEQREENKRPGRLTAMHSSGCGFVNDQWLGVTIVVLLAGTGEFTLTQKPRSRPLPWPGSYTQTAPASTAASGAPLTYPGAASTTPVALHFSKLPRVTWRHQWPVPQAVRPRWEVYVSGTRRQCRVRSCVHRLQKYRLTLAELSAQIRHLQMK